MGWATKKGAEESFKYSLNEVKTSKIWIDGKPIYRRTFDVPVGTGLGSEVIIEIGLTIGNYFKILDGGLLRVALNDFTSIPFIDPDNTNYSIGARSNILKTQIIINNGSLSDHNGGWITLEYTKL